MEKYIFIVFLIICTLAQGQDYRMFKGTPIKVSFVKELSDQSMYIYVDDSYTEAKSDDQFLSIQNQLNIEIENITPIFRYTTISMGDVYTIYKYKAIISETETKVITKFLVYKNDLWKEVVSPFKLMKTFFDVFSSIKLDCYKAFVSKSDDPNFPEINKLKPLVKDANGILNIEKLAKVINDNRATLSKYLDD